MVARNRILEISKHAGQVRRDSGAAERYLHGGYTRVDPFQVAGSEALPVMLRPLQELLGAFLRESDIAGILVNADRPPGLIHMTCAHELGHYFLGHPTTTDRNLDYGPNADPKEKEADFFAYQLLMPRELIVAIMRRKHWSNDLLRDPATIYQLSLRMGTSYTATIWSLIRHDLLNIGAEEARRIAGVPLQRLKQRLIGVRMQGAISDVWVLDKSDKDLILEPRTSDQFLLDLPSHASAGFLWSLKDATEAGFGLQPLTVGSGDTEHFPEGPLVVGGETQQRYVLNHGPAAVNTPRVRLTFQEQQPWQASLAPNDEFNTTTEFESIQLGLNTQSRERLIEEISSS
jgi:hypothetical protein